MIGLAVVERATPAARLVAAAEQLIGKQPLIAVVSIIEKGPIETQRQAIRTAIESVDQGEGVLVLTDDLDGSATSLSSSLLSAAVPAMVAGVNLPMLIRLCQLRRERRFAGGAVALAREAQRHGRQGIVMTLGPATGEAPAEADGGPSA